MKVAVSIPDQVFAEAESLVKRFKTSRSELYSRALRAFVGLHAPERVTEAMNAALDAVGPEPDDFTAAAARQALSRAEW